MLRTSPVITSRRWKYKSIQSAVVGGISCCKAKNKSFSFMMMSSRNTSPKAVALFANPRRTGDPRPPSKMLRPTRLLTLPPQLAFGLPGLLSKSQQHPESGRHIRSDQRASSGCESSGAHEDQHCLTMLHPKDCRAMTQDGSLIMLFSLNSM